MRGFSLLELLVVISMFGVIASVCAVSTIQELTATLSRNDASEMFSTFMEARAASMHGICASGTCNASTP